MCAGLGERLESKQGAGCGLTPELHPSSMQEM